MDVVARVGGYRHRMTALAAIGFVVAACGGSTGTPAATDGTTAPSASGSPGASGPAVSPSAAGYDGPAVQLTFTNFYTGPDLETMESMIETFNSEHPNITVKNNAIDGATQITELPQLVAAGRAADVEAHHDFGFPQLAARNTLDELTPEILASMGVTADQYFENVWNLGISGGKQYGVPWGATSAVLYHNNKLMTDSGVTAVPTNRDELLAAAKQCTKDTAGRAPGEAGFDGSKLDTYGVGIPQEFGWLVGTGTLKSSGGSLWDDSYNVAFNSPEAVDAITWLYNLSAVENVAPDGVGWEADIASFRSSKSCFLLTGLWELKGNQEASGLDFGLAVFPQLGSAEPASWGGAAWLVLPRQPESYDQNKRAAAVEFIRWMTSFEGSLAWTESGNLTARPDVAQSPEYAQNPAVEVAKNLERLYIPSGFPWIGQINDGWNQAFSAVMLGSATPSDALAARAAEAQANVDQAKADYPDFQP